MVDNSLTKKNVVRKRRTLRIRKNLRGTSEKPRLCVIKTGKHIFAQLIDDSQGATLCSASTIAKAFQGTEFNRKNKSAAKQIGLQIGKLAKKKSIKRVVFDRGRFKYHGLMAAVADGAREQGLEF